MSNAVRPTRPKSAVPSSVATESAVVPVPAGDTTPRTASSTPQADRPLNLTRGREHIGLGLRGIDGAIGMVAPFLPGPMAGGTVEPLDMLGELVSMVKRVQDGNLSDAEAVLATQALSLNILAGELLSRAANNIDRPVGTLDLYVRLGLKAQNQSRMTLETLAEIKNPRPVLIAKQVNVAQQQQVNNGPQAAPAPADTSRTKQRCNVADRTIRGDE